MVKKQIIEQNGIKYEVIRVIEKGKSQEEIEFEEWSNRKFCLKAVEQDGYSLQYVKDQTEQICLKAVEQNGDSLRYVKIKKVFLRILRGRQ